LIVRLTALACAAVALRPAELSHHAGVISPDLQSFIARSVRSVWALELLLLLKREPERAWTADALVAEMRASAPLVAEVLATFESSGLTRRNAEGEHLWAPNGPALALLSDELERLYRERPATTVKAILSTPNDKLQSFADAFRIRGDGQ
jgi:hypothetical protein